MNDRMTLLHKPDSVFYWVRTSGLIMRLLFLITLASGCAKTIDGGSDGESHFLSSCDAECEQGYSCICGVCTEGCDDDARCSDLAPTALCVEVKAAKGCSSNNDDVFGFCDVACKSSQECSVLGSGYGCSAGFCRKGVDPASRDAGNAYIKEDSEILIDAGFESEWEVVESNTIENLSALPLI